jgi:hypothetical protein
MKHQRQSTNALGLTLKLRFAMDCLIAGRWEVEGAGQQKERVS